MVQVNSFTVIIFTVQVPQFPTYVYTHIESSTHYWNDTLIFQIHHVQLAHIHRQTDDGLKIAINEVARGEVSPTTEALLVSLMCPHSNPSYHFFATNLEVAEHNTNQLHEIEGEYTMYKSINSGYSKYNCKMLHLQIIVSDGL